MDDSAETVDCPPSAETPTNDDDYADVDKNDESSSHNYTNGNADDSSSNNISTTLTRTNAKKAQPLPSPSYETTTSEVTDFTKTSSNTNPNPDKAAVKTSEEKLTGQNVFEEMVNANTFKGTLRAFKKLCEALNLDPLQHKQFYAKLNSLVLTWRAKHLWAKLSKRANEDVYRKGNAAINTKVLIIGAGPCGLRTAIECAFLGAKVVLIEKRDAFTRNNVLHLWDVVIRDLNSLGAKKLYKKFCISSIDHISIRQLQLILLKIALLLGVEIHHSVAFEDVIAPDSAIPQWRAKFNCQDPEVQTRLNEYDFDVLIGADGRRNSFSDFKRYANRAKLAIAITANFKNMHSNEENAVAEIAGVTSYAKPELFRKLAGHDINLENIVYYKDATHYFIMTAHKGSLLQRGVLLADHAETDMLLSEANINQEELLKFAQEAAAIATSNKLPLSFAKNHYNQPDVAMFDFTSMYYADHAARIYKQNGKFLLKILVGDSLIEPFWPTGSGIGKGFLSSMDAAWTVKNWASGSCSVNQIIAEHESCYKSLFSLLSSDKLKALPSKHFYPLDPFERYTSMLAPSTRDIKPLFLCDETPSSVESETEIVAPDTLEPERLLQWAQNLLTGDGHNYSDFVIIENLTSSWQDARGFAALIHVFQPELISIEKAKALTSEELASVVFSKLQAFGIYPSCSPSDFCSEVPEQLSVLSILVPFYHRFYDVLPAHLLPKYNRILDSNTEFMLPISNHVTKANDERRTTRQNHKHTRSNAPHATTTVNTSKTEDSLNIPIFARESSSSAVGTPKTKHKHQRAAKKLDLSENKWIESLNDETIYQKSSLGDKKSTRSRKARRSVGGAGDLADYLSDHSSSPSNSPSKKADAEKVKCLYCKEDVLMLDRMLLEGHYFHRSCFRCIYCKKVLTERTYSYFKSEDDPKTNHFYCSTHHRWRTEGYIGPPTSAAEKLPGHNANSAAPAKKKGLAALLTDIPIQQAVKPVERITIEVSKAQKVVKKELTEEEMSDFNYGPGYQTAENVSEVSSDEASDAPNALLDSAVLSTDAFVNWREVYSARKFLAGAKTANDDKHADVPTQRVRKQVESEDDADNEGATEIEDSDSSSSVNDSGTEVDMRDYRGSDGSNSATDDSSCMNTAQELSDTEPKQKQSPNKRKFKGVAKVKLPLSATHVEDQDSETEVENERNTSPRNVKRRRPRRPRPARERITKINPALIRLKTEGQPEPISLDVLLGVNSNESVVKKKANSLHDISPEAPQPPSNIVHRREVVKIRSNFLEAQPKTETLPVSSNFGEQNKIAESSKETVSVEPATNAAKNTEPKSPKHSETKPANTIADSEEIVKKTLDYIPASSTLTLMEQLDETYKDLKREADLKEAAAKEPLKQVRIVTPTPEENRKDKASPPVPAFDPRVNVENSVRKALGSKTREEERRERKAKLADLKAMHFGVSGGPSSSKDLVPSTSANNSVSPVISPVLPGPTSSVRVMKVTTYMSKEFTKLPGSSTVNIEKTVSNKVEIPIKIGTVVPKEAATILLKQKAAEQTKKNESGETIEQVKTVHSTATVKPLTGAGVKPAIIEGKGVLKPAIENCKNKDSSTTALPFREPRAIESSKCPGSHSRSASTSVAFPSTALKSNSIGNAALPARTRPLSLKPSEETSKTAVADKLRNENLPGFQSDSNDPKPEMSRSISNVLDGQPQQNVKHTKLNSTVKVMLFDPEKDRKESSKPRPILSYKDSVTKKSNQCLTDTELPDPGVLSDSAAAPTKSSKGGSLGFLKKFRSNFSSDKQSKLSKQRKGMKSTPALNEAANYFDEPATTADKKSKTLTAPSPSTSQGKDKKSFSDHFRMRSSTLLKKSDMQSSPSGLPSKEMNKSDSNLGQKRTNTFSAADANRKSGNKATVSPEVEEEFKVPSSKLKNEPSHENVFEFSITESKSAESSSSPVQVKNVEPEKVVPKKEEIKEDDQNVEGNNTTPTADEPPPVAPNMRRNTEVAEMLKNNRKARQTKQREKIKQMQLKLGLKYLPGTLETKIDSITDFCSGKRTPGVNKDLDDLYDEVASTEKNLPYFKQTDLRRSMEKLADPRLQQSFELLLDDQSPIPIDSNLNGSADPERDKELKQMELIAKRLENVEHVNRCQNLERLAREIEEKEVVLQSVSEKGQAIEKELTDKKIKKKEKAELTPKWIEVKEELEKVTADISELAYAREQLILEDRHYNLKQEIRDLMSVPEGSKTEAQVEREKELLQEIIQVVEDKNKLVENLESERLLDEQQSDGGMLAPDRKTRSLSSQRANSTGTMRNKRKLKTIFKK